HMGEGIANKIRKRPFQITSFAIDDRFLLVVDLLDSEDGNELTFLALLAQRTPRVIDVPERSPVRRGEHNRYGEKQTQRHEPNPRMVLQHGSYSPKDLFLPTHRQSA